MPAQRRPALTQEAAEQLAIQALSFIAAEPDRLGGFLAASGIGPDRIRTAAREPGFLGGVLDYLSTDDRMLLDFAAATGFEPAIVAKARAVLGDAGWERDVP